MVVLKFGGTSVADADAIGRAAAIVAREEPPIVVVVSALAGVTDRLLSAAALAASGEIDAALGAVAALRARHVEVAAVVSDSEDGGALREAIADTFAQLDSVTRGCFVLRELSPRALDAIAAAGELLSSRIVTSAFRRLGLPSVWVDARQVILTDAEFTAAAPLTEPTSIRVDREIRARVERGLVPVVGGFVGATADGDTTTLGRGGSDYSAAIIGACLDAREIQLWTDVDGMLTADPRIVPAPRPVPHLSFAEAYELAYFGAKVLHPATIEPAVARNIPVRILNSRRPDLPGTLISGTPSADRRPLTAVACRRGVTVIDVTSARPVRPHDFQTRVFDVLRRLKTRVAVVSASGARVSIAVDEDEDRRLLALERALGEFADLACHRDLALVSVVGDRLQADPALVADVLTTLGDVSIRMMSQPPSGRTISVALRQDELEAAVSRLHARFFERGTPDYMAPSIGAGV